MVTFEKTTSLRVFKKQLMQAVTNNYGKYKQIINSALDLESDEGSSHNERDNSPNTYSASMVAAEENTTGM